MCNEYREEERGFLFFFFFSRKVEKNVQKGNLISFRKEMKEMKEIDCEDWNKEIVIRDNSILV